MAFGVSLFLNIFLLAAVVFLYRELKTLKGRQKETEAIFKIRAEAKTRALKELAENLEKEVGQRTETLQEKIKELEKFQKLTVERELKMVELKEEIKKLKEELEEKKGQVSE